MRAELLLADPLDCCHPLAIMVFAEIKTQIEQLPHEELLKAMAYLKHRLRSDNPEYQRELAQRHADINSGRGVTLTEAKKRLENR